MARSSNTERVRLANTHQIYKEHYIEPSGQHTDIHITGFDPVDGQVVQDENGQVLTPAYEVPRTSGVAHAIHVEHRLISVVDDDDWDRLNAENGTTILDARKRREDANPRPAAGETVTLSRAEYDAMTAALGTAPTGKSTTVARRVAAQRAAAAATEADDSEGAE